MLVLLIHKCCMVCQQPLQFVSPALAGSVNKMFSHTVMTSQVPITTSASGIVTQPVATSVVTSQPSPVASPIPVSSIATVPGTMSTQVLCRPGTPGTLQLQPRAMMPLKQTTAIRPQNRPLSPIIRTPTPIRVTAPLNKTTTIASKVPPKLTAAQLRMQSKGLTSPMVTLGTAGLTTPDSVNSGSVSTVLTTAVAHSVNSSIAAPVVSSVASLAGVGASPMGVTPVVSASMSSGTPTTVISSASNANTVFAPGSQISRIISKDKDKKLIGATPSTTAASAAAAAAASSSYTCVQLLS